MNLILRNLMVASVLGWLAVFTLPLHAEDKAHSEKEKFEQLIQRVENLQDAKFVRNGKEYDAKTAGKFLKGKWDANSSKIKTAQDFIEVAATKSSTSGKPYLIRYADGKEIPSAEFLTAELKAIESP